jgi:hypothetical protein
MIKPEKLNDFKKIEKQSEKIIIKKVQNGNE